MGSLGVCAKISHVPSMYLSERPGPRQGSRQTAIDHSAGPAKTRRRKR